MKGLSRSVVVTTILFCSNLILATTEINTQNVIEASNDTILEVEVKPETLENSLKSNCFHADVDKFCFNGEKTSNCECFESSLDPTAIVCCNVTDISRSLQCMRSNVSAYEKVHIINARQKEIDVSTLNSIKKVQSLAITDGSITKITGQFAKFSSIICLNFSSNNISEISDRALSHLNHLKLLDLSSNNLTKLPSTKGQTFIDIRNSPKITCRNVSAALERGIEFLYKNISTCETFAQYNWFNSTFNVELLNLENVKKISNCPEKCICEEDGMIYTGKEGKGVFVVKVDCSNKMHTSLPEKLPENTHSLIISNNSITSLAPIANNDYYDFIRILYADDNQISSIEDIGKKFIQNFRILSLKNNKIKYMPHYILSNLEKNSNGAMFYFEGNRLHCECATAKNLRVNFYFLTFLLSIIDFII
jgi:hypothetical protein